MIAKVAISGGSGMIGQHLTKMLKRKGYEVLHISRTQESSVKDMNVIIWDVKNQKLSTEALEGVDFVIHLAGANIFEKKWTEKNKKVIIDSRVQSANLLYDSFEKLGKKPKAVISASAVGYYGSQTSDHIFVETDTAGKDFLGKTCDQWEKSIEVFSELGIRNVKLRQPMVLAKEKSALQRLAFPIKFGLGAALGSGKQWMPWIHVDDLCRLYVFCLENEKMQGSYNAVAPHHVNNKSFTKIVAKVLNRPLLLPNIPKILIKAIFGEKSSMILEGSRVSSDKLKQNGFDFTYKNLEVALEDIYQ